VADKQTQHVIDALSKAAAAPGGLALFAAKAEPGLFPAAAAARPAAQKCLADGLIALVPAAGPRERYALTGRGWDYLLAAVNPKQVLEDFVRVLEARQGEVGELLATARRMADSLHGLREAVARVLPRVVEARVQEPNPPAPFPKKEGGAGEDRRAVGSSSGPPPFLGEGLGERFFARNGTAVLDAPPAAGLAAAVLARLSEWAATAAAGEDCPLPALYRGLPAASVGAFHDCLRELHAAGAVYLHPWTGPLYALPEPALALLVGHGVAFYASRRHDREGVKG